MYTPEFIPRILQHASNSSDLGKKMYHLVIACVIYVLIELKPANLFFQLFQAFRCHLLLLRSLLVSDFAKRVDRE